MMRRRAYAMCPALMEVLRVFDAMPPQIGERRAAVAQAGRLALAALGVSASRTLPGLLAAAAEAHATLALDAKLQALLNDYFGVYHENHANKAVCLVSAGADVHTRSSPSRHTALHLAAGAGAHDAARALLRLGADPAARIVCDEDDNDQGATPLHLAAKLGHAHVFDLLLRADRTLLEARDDGGQTPLFYAARSTLRAFEALLERGASWRVTDADGTGPLTWAVFFGSTGVARRLLDLGADVDALDYNGATPLMLAAQGCSFDTVQLLLDRGANIEARCRTSSRTALCWASSTSHDNHVIMSLLLDRGALHVPDGAGDFPLHLAARAGNASAVRALLDRGVDVDAEDAGGATALLVVLETAVSRTVPERAGPREIAEVLIAKGARVDATHAVTGAQPLHLAILLGIPQVVSKLITLGAPLNTVAFNGRSPLHCACAAGCEASVFHLLHHAHVDDFGLRDREGLTPLDIACARGFLAIIERLFEFCSRQCGREDMANDWLEERRWPGRATPLHFAAANGHAEVAELLLDEGAEVNAAGAGLVAPLHLAASHGWPSVARLLLERGALVGALDARGKTALWHASMGGHTKVALLLRDWAA